MIQYLIQIYYQTTDINFSPKSERTRQTAISYLPLGNKKVKIKIRRRVKNLIQIV